ncbi:MAG: hypothetical protein KGJ89_03230 [Patescibacteria group bacterium]|nr:hypothetical protein [Patescibacteria group bacterium]MDE2015439.1 hypothetical protein [Patescibacteria group bacterium]MDE2226946.1 hypothetical protein [Patescibacteria group bacterium]
MRDNSSPVDKVSVVALLIVNNIYQHRSAENTLCGISCALYDLRKRGILITDLDFYSAVDGHWHSHFIDGFIVNLYILGNVAGCSGYSPGQESIISDLNYKGMRHCGEIILEELNGSYSEEFRKISEMLSIDMRELVHNLRNSMATQQSLIAK